MADLITLSCPSCGGSLQITSEIDRFACGYCGQEHIVNRKGGIVSLFPVVDALKRVSAGVDKTASELAIIRLQKEIIELNSMKQSIMNNSQNAKKNDNCAVIAMAISMVIFGLLWGSFEPSGYFLAFVGLAIFIIGIPFITKEISNNASNDQMKKSKINKIERDIFNKNEELKRHLQNVSM